MFIAQEQYLDTALLFKDVSRMSPYRCNALVKVCMQVHFTRTSVGICLKLHILIWGQRTMSYFEGK